MHVKRILSSLILLLIINTQVYAEVYKWTDESGKVHFSDKPHSNAQAININAPKASGNGVSNDRLKRQNELLLEMRNKREGRQKQADKKQRYKNKVSNYCVSLKNRIRDFEEVDYVYSRDQTGKKRRFSNDEKNQRTNKLKQQYKERCS